MLTGTIAGKEREANLTLLIEYDGSNNPIWIGEAAIGTAPSEAGWRIKKITYDGSNNPTSRQWAGGGMFEQVWDDRAAYSYS